MFCVINRLVDAPTTLLIHVNVDFMLHNDEGCVINTAHDIIDIHIEALLM